MTLRRRVIPAIVAVIVAAISSVFMIRPTPYQLTVVVLGTVAIVALGLWKGTVSGPSRRDGPGATRGDPGAWDPHAHRSTR